MVRVLLEIVAMLIVLLVMSLLLGLGLVWLIVGKYVQGIAVLAIFLFACFALPRIAKRLDHWAKPLPAPLIPVKYRTFVSAGLVLSFVCLGAWFLYMVGSGLAEGEMQTLNRIAHNHLVSAKEQPVEFWFTVAKGTYLGLVMIYAGFWVIHKRRQLSNPAFESGRAEDPRAAQRVR